MKPSTKVNWRSTTPKMGDQEQGKPEEEETKFNFKLLEEVS